MADAEVLRSCAVVLPAQRSAWAAAMRMEAYSTSMMTARRSVGARQHARGLCRRLRATRAHKMLTFRSLAVLWIVMFVFSSAFNVSIALAARLRFQVWPPQWAGCSRWLPLRSLRSVCRRNACGLFVLMGLVVVLFAVSLVLSLRRRPAAFAAFCSAVGLSLVAWLYQLGIPAYMQAMSPQHRWRIGAALS
jgi:hypothetical protein